MFQLGTEQILDVQNQRRRLKQTTGALDCDKGSQRLSCLKIVAGRADGLKELGRVNETGTLLFRAGKWCQAGENLPNLAS